MQLFALGDEITLEIDDDGEGFDTSALQATPGFGVSGMIERARGLGGWAEVSSLQGRGTTVMFSIPTHADRSAHEVTERRSDGD
jgi:signal transduction histidine kinase